MLEVRSCFPGQWYQKIAPISFFGLSSKINIKLKTSLGELHTESLCTYQVFHCYRHLWIARYQHNSRPFQRFLQSLTKIERFKQIHVDLPPPSQSSLLAVYVLYLSQLVRPIPWGFPSTYIIFIWNCFTQMWALTFQSTFHEIHILTWILRLVKEVGGILGGVASSEIAILLSRDSQGMFSCVCEAISLSIEVPHSHTPHSCTPQESNKQFYSKQSQNTSWSYPMFKLIEFIVQLNDTCKFFSISILDVVWNVV